MASSLQPIPMVQSPWFSPQTAFIPDSTFDVGTLSNSDLVWNLYFAIHVPVFFFFSRTFLYLSIHSGFRLEAPNEKEDV